MIKPLLAAATLGLMATSVAAQYVPPPYQEFRRPPPDYREPRNAGPPVVARPYNWCEARSQRLREFEYRVQRDGRVSRDEDRVARSLRADLAATCGGGRWRPNRGWHYN